MIKPAHVSTWGKPAKSFDAFIRSATRVGLKPHNADPSIWPGDDWRTIEWFRKTQAQYRFVQDHPEFTHFLFTDSYDIICAADWFEIMSKFKALDSPIVFGAEAHPWPKQEQAILYPETLSRCKYLNAGLWMGERSVALEFLAHISAIAAKREQCDQGICVDALLSRKFPIKLDNSCSLLFCMNVGSPEFLDCSGARPKTTDTGEEPCFFHGNGNSDLTPVIQCLKL
jgi:hypothetical protein